MSFLQVFDSKYKKRLGKRYNTFRSIFSLLEDKRKGFYVIIETGCVRNKNNIEGDGISTLIFDEFLNFYDGVLYTVDISEEHCNVARKNTTNKVVVSCKDSIEYLWNFNVASADLVYLDSFDLDISNPHPSMIHHFNEFCAILPTLNSGCLVVVDDHVNDDVGKDKYISDFMGKIGKEKFIDGYQVGWLL